MPAEAFFYFFAKVRELFVERLAFLRAGRAGRSQQRKQGTIGDRQCDDVEAVAVYPVVVLPITPAAIAVHAAEFLGNRASAYRYSDATTDYGGDFHQLPRLSGPVPLR